VKKAAASHYPVHQERMLHRNNYMLRRIGDLADAPRSLVTFRGIFVAAALLLAFWAYVLSIVF
jgi:hypothetical protein